MSWTAGMWAIASQNAWNISQLSISPYPDISKCAQNEINEFGLFNFTKNDILEILHTQPNVAIFQITKGRVRIKSGDLDKTEHPAIRKRMVTTNLEFASQHFVLPEVAFALNLGDVPTVLKSQHKQPLPAFGFCSTGAHWERVFPLQEIQDFSLEKTWDFDRILKWEQKQGKAFWRGSTTGGHYDAGTWRDFPRTKLVMLSKKYRVLLDAKFTSCTQCSNAALEEIEQELGFVGYLERHDQLAYKYIVDVDGNGWSSRFRSLLSSKSVVLKQKSVYRDFFDSVLVPGKHFFPIREDLNDLLDAIRALRDDDEMARSIASEAFHFSQQNLSPRAAALYIAELLNRYSLHCVDCTFSDDFFD